MMKSTVLIFVFIFCFCCQSDAQINSIKPSNKSVKNRSADNRDAINFELAFFNGLRQKALGNIDAALNEFLKCVRLDGTKATPMYELAMIYNNLSQYTEALFFIESAYKIQPKNTWYLQLLAQLYINNQKYRSAITAYKNLLKEQVGNQEWHFQLANAYLLNGELKKAILVYNDMQAYTGFDERLSMQKYKIYLDLKDKKGAINELENWIVSRPKDPTPYGLIAEIYLLEGNQKKAIETLERILIISPNNGKANLTLSELYRNNGQLDKSLKSIKLAFASSDLSIDSKMRILINYYDITTNDSILKNEAFDLIEILKEKHPNDARPFTIAGDYHYRDGNLIKAKEAFEKALFFDESRFPIWQQLMIICFDLKEFESVQLSAQKAIDLFPSQPISYLLGAMAHVQTNNYDAAINLLNTGKLMVFDNNDLLAQFYATLGDAHHAQKNHQMSDESYEKSLEISPLNTYVLNNYSYYLSLRNEKLDRAQEMMEVCTSISPGVPSYEDTYAWIFYQKAEYVKAEEWLLRALQSGGDKSAVIVEHYGDVLFKLGKVTAAVSQWKKAKELGSDTPEIDKKISEQKLYE